MRNGPVADVALICEGTYPFIRGGVSTWVHQLIEGLPDVTFTVTFLGSRPEHYKGFQYALPPNVLDFQAHYLMLWERLPPPRSCTGNQEAFALRDHVHEAFKRTQELVDREMLGRFFNGLGRALGIPVEAFLYSLDTWKVVTESYERYCTDPSFLDYFWTIRSMHLPVFALAEISPRVLPTRVIHPVSTGYAGLLGVMLSLRTQCPLVLTEHGIYTKERRIDLIHNEWLPDPVDPLTLRKLPRLGSLRQLWIRFFENVGRLVYGVANPIIAISEANRIRQVADGAPEERTRVISNGVDPDRFRAARHERPRAIPPVAALVGRVTPIKDVKTFIRAMRIVRARVPRAEGWVVGPLDEDPAYVRECETLVTLLGLGGIVKFLGVQTPEAIYPRIGVNVLTSISESMPLVLLEGFASGVPAVATDVGACRDLIEGAGKADRALGAAGLVVPMADPHEAGEAIVRLLTDEGLWHAAQQAAILRVERFYDIQQVFDAYRALYRGLGAQATGAFPSPA